MSKTLHVYLFKSLVGVLTQNQHGEITFQYNSEWLDSEIASPLSRSLPLRQEPFTPRETRPFFGGVLPEASQKEKIASNLGVSSKNYFALLDGIGGECAGAVTFMRPGERPLETEYRYRAISDLDLSQILSDLPIRPLMAGEAGVRLSLAGAQGKLAVHVSNSQFSIPLGSSPSTHIIKPAIGGFEGTVFNEFTCMRLARLIGLNVADVEVRRVENVEFLLIKRYDRTTESSGRVNHVHQEDFCQALGIASEYKYQSEGGPTLQQCFKLIRESSELPVVDLLAFLDCVIFNLIIGNNDAHGKNFSLLYGSNSTRLAPFYDLLSTEIYPELHGKTAMKIGGEYQPKKIQLQHLEQLADEAEFGRVSVKRRVRSVCERVTYSIHSVESDLPVCDKLVQIIKENCVHVKQIAAG